MFRSRVLPFCAVISLALGLGLAAAGSASADGPALSDGCANLHQFDANDGVLGSPGVVVIDPRLFDAGEQVRFVGDSSTGGSVRVTVGTPGAQVNYDAASGQLIRIEVPVATSYYFILTPVGGGSVSWHPGCGIPPTAVVASPAGGQTYTVGQHVSTSFGCSPQTNPLATCLDSKGSVPPSDTLDTATAGTHTYAVTATDDRGLQRTTSISYTVVKQAQTISFTSAAPTAAVVFGPSYQATATATSGGVVDLAIDPASSGVCAVSSSNINTVTLTFTGVGTCTINANQGGDDTYAPAPQVSQSFPVGRGVALLDAIKASKGLLGLTPTTFSAVLRRPYPTGPGTIYQGYPGQTITFSLAGKTLCTAVTDGFGAASCKAAIGLANALTQSSYTASYGGSDLFGPVTATGKLQ